MSADAIKTVAVLGAGTMGNGIAHVFARSGYQVILRDVEKRFLDRGLETITKNLDREVKKGKLAEADKAAALERIEPVTDLAALARADIAIEAVPEVRELKARVLKDVDAALRPEVILASNTSSIAITGIAKQGNAADVEFTWRWTPLNEFGAALYSSDLRYRSTVAFRDYDDGWRAVESGAHSGQPLGEALKNAEPLP